jgi:hypothetical protein
MTTGGESLIDRMRGAALLDVETYEAVEADENATGQAAVVVLIVAACKAIGASGIGLFGAGLAALISLGAWLVWAGITYVVGDKVFGGTATWGEVLRTTGFAQAPGILFLFGFLPLVGGMTTLVASIWILVAGFIALRQALDIGNGQTLLTVLIGGLIYGVLQNLPLTPF